MRIKLPAKSLILLRNFNTDKNTCNLLLYNVTTSMNSLTPIHQGKISFTYDKNKLRPYRYQEKTGNTYRYLKAKDAIALLGSVNLIAMLADDKPKNTGEFLEFLSHCKAEKPKILPVCIICMQDKKELTRITNSTTYDIYGKDSCKSCASTEIKDEYIKRGIPISISARKFYNSQLDRLRNVGEVIETIWEPIKAAGSNSSLFDIINSDKDSKPVSLKKYFQQKKNEYRIDKELIEYWTKIGMHQLMPVQVKAIEGGLLRKQDLLIVAGTSSGKTFVGELAGVHNWKTRNEKFIFVTPLVALTNQRYDSFKKRYKPLGARVSIRVGKSRIADKENNKQDGNFAKADIIVATYEALDWIFRSGQWKKIPNIGTLIIDEFQLLADEERGGEVDGLMARIRSLYPRCQIIGLSATIGNEEELAKEMNLKLVNYMQRPVPLERHLIISDGDEKKVDILERLVRDEAHVRSKSGYKGQSLIFTNTRRRVQEIGNILKGMGIRSGYYHAGMTYSQRRIVEKQFEDGRLDVLTTTAALGAGADFPVSQVIFERPAMGAKWISIAEYHQMAGRAGRLGYHDVGKAIMIATVGEKIYKSQDKSEEQIAFEILTGEVEDIEGEVEYEQELDQVLAYVSAAFPITNENMKQYYDTLFFRTNQLSNIVKTLLNKGLIAKKEEKWYITPLGRAISESFLKPSFGYSIAKQTKTKDIKEIAIEIAPFESVYVTSRVQSKIEHALKTHISSRFFSDTVLETITDMRSIKGKLSPSLMSIVRFWQRNFLESCSCKISPYCQHPRIQVSSLVLDLRMTGHNITQISNILSKEYHLQVYQGDLLNWLDEIIHAINAIGRLAKAMKNNDLLASTNELALSIEAPEINFSLNKKIVNSAKTRKNNNSKEVKQKPHHLRRKTKKSVRERNKERRK